MSALERAGVARRFILGGLCSGGDLTFQTALHDPRVVGAVIMNPRTFCVNDLALVETEQRARDHVGGARRASPTAPGPLRELVRGETIGALLTNVRRVSARALGARASTTCRRGCASWPSAASTPSSSRASTIPASSTSTATSRRQMRALDGLPRFRRADLAGTDHTFTSLFAQELVATTLSDHLAQSWR